MKVLLTGHHGYIGSIVAQVLRSAGHDVTGLDTLFYEGCDLPAVEDVSVPAIQADVRDVRPPGCGNRGRRPPGNGSGIGSWTGGLRTTRPRDVLSTPSA